MQKRWDRLQPEYYDDPETSPDTYWMNGIEAILTEQPSHKGEAE